MDDDTIVVLGSATANIRDFSDTSWCKTGILYSCVCQVAKEGRTVENDYKRLRSLNYTDH